MMPFPMGGINPQQMVQRMIQMNPNLQNNPQAQQYIQVLMNGDAKRGEELARNICQSYGVTPEQGVQQAQNFIKQHFFNQGG